MSQSAPMILANDFKALWQDTGGDVEAALRRVGESGWFILGKEVSAFEEAFAKYWGSEFAVGCANGMDAIEISLRALGLKEGDKVLTTPLSAFATSLAIVRAGGVPVFVDTDSHGLIDLDACRTALEKDASIRYVVPVHLFGISLDLGKLGKLRDDFDLKIVEDCAQAIGAGFNGASVGSVGQMSITSFYPTKNLGAMGDAGALVTNSEKLAKDALCLRDYGQSAKYVHSEMGLNSRLDELQAAILSDAMLPRLDGWLKRRREIAHRYLDEIRNEKITVLGSPEGSESVWHLFPVMVANERDAFLQHLRDHSIMGGIHYPGLIPDQPAFENSPFETVGELTNAKLMAANEASLPIHPYLKDEDIAAVIDACNKW